MWDDVALLSVVKLLLLPLLTWCDCLLTCHSFDGVLKWGVEMLLANLVQLEDSRSSRISPAHLCAVAGCLPAISAQFLLVVCRVSLACCWDQSNLCGSACPIFIWLQFACPEESLSLVWYLVDTARLSHDGFCTGVSLLSGWKAAAVWFWDLCFCYRFLKSLLVVDILEFCSLFYVLCHCSRWSFSSKYEIISHLLTFNTLSLNESHIFLVIKHNLPTAENTNTFVIGG